MRYCDRHACRGVLEACDSRTAPIFWNRSSHSLDERGIRYCVIGGQGVNAYAEPLVSLDLDLVVAVDQMDEAARLLESRFTVERFPHSLNIAAAGPDLRVQVRTDPRDYAFVDRAARRTVLGIELPVASVETAKTFSISSASSTGVPIGANAFCRICSARYHK